MLKTIIEWWCYLAGAAAFLVICFYALAFLLCYLCHLVGMFYWSYLILEENVGDSWWQRIKWVISLWRRLGFSFYCCNEISFRNGVTYENFKFKKHGEER